MKNCLRNIWMVPKYLVAICTSNSTNVVCLFVRGSVTNQLPQFVGRLKNSSVPVGRDAVFRCNVRGLGKYRVSKKQKRIVEDLCSKVLTVYQFFFVGWMGEGRYQSHPVSS